MGRPPGHRPMTTPVTVSDVPVDDVYALRYEVAAT